MKKDTRLKSFAKTFVAVVFVASPTVGTVAQGMLQLPQEVKERRASAKEAMKKKANTPKRAASATGVQLYGYITVSEEHAPGLYTFNTSNPDGIKLVAGSVSNYGGATYAQGTLWSQYYQESDDNSKITMPIRLYGYNTADWTQTAEKRGYEFTNISADLAFDPVTQQLYGIFADADYSGKYTTIGRITYEDVEQDGHTFNLYHCDPIGEMPERMVAITFNKGGQMYAIGKSGKLYAVDKYSGKAQEICGSIRSIVPAFQSATCDYTTGKIYWAAFDADDWASYIMEIDPETKESKLVSNFGFDMDTYTGTATYDQFTSLYMKQDLTLTALPETVSDLTVTAKGSDGADVAFTVPAKDANGNAITQDVEWTLRVNGNQQAHGNSEPGKEVKQTVGGLQSGNATFAVTVTIPATGDSPAAETTSPKKEIYLGDEAPKPATDAKATAEGNDVTLSWTAPTQTVNGNPVSADKLSYSVARFMNDNAEDSVVVAESTKETSLTDHIDNQEMAQYYYKVVAINGDMKGEAAVSNKINAGVSVALPYSNKLSSENDFNKMSVADANNDGTIWHFDDNYSMAAYTGNSYNAADDWLISPAVSVKKGAAYKFSFDAVNSYPTERVAASVGDAPTADAMTTEIIEPTDVTYQPRRRTLTGTYRATEDGLRYFGVHAVSDKDLSTLFVDALKISEIPATVPDAVTELTVTPGDKGASTAAINFKAPTTTLGGEPLTGKLSINIYRNGTSVTTLTGIEPGQKGSYNDQDVPQGETLYSITAVNSNYEEGLEATKKVYVGSDEPGAVRNLRAYEDAETEGLIHVTWDAPQGVHGGYINPDEISYYISAGFDYNNHYLGTANHYEDQLNCNGKQTYSGYTVYASNASGDGSQYKQTVTAIGGPAVKAPMIESFKGNTMKSGPWITTVTKGEIGDAYCYAMSESEVTKPQDNDGGMQSFSAVANGKAVRSESPKVDITALNSPVLNFWAYMNGKGEKLRVSVQKDYKEFVDAMEISTDQYEKGWHRFTLDLTPYKDSKYIRVGFEGESVKDLDFFLAYDNVAIVDNVDKDLSATALTAGENVKAGGKVNLSLSLRNNSSAKVNGADYSIVLYKNGKEQSRTNGTDIDADMVKSVKLTDETTVFDPEETVYYAAIDFPGDKLTDNNTSESKTVKVLLPEYPTPTSLNAASAGNGVELAWTAPDMENRDAQVTKETFDNYEAFAISDFGDWTTYDCDQQNTIQITLDASFGPLQYKNAGKPMAFQVFNVEKAGIPFASWDPHSGSQMLVSFACASNDGGFSKKQNDDWLISPELNGEAQTIKFYAKAGLASAVPEQMEILYSTTDKAIGSFQKIDETVDVDNAAAWDEYMFYLPEGAKYFAIRCVSNDKFALLIDDISYIAADATPEDLSLLGYNVYRDKVKINDKPLQAESYTDLTAQQNESYGYQVTAVYDKGESLPSNVAKVTYVSGIRDIEAGNIRVTGGNGAIFVGGADGKDVRIYSVNGAMKAQFTAHGDERIAVSAGLYIVNVADATFKVAVR